MTKEQSVQLSSPGSGLSVEATVTEGEPSTSERQREAPQRDTAGVVGALIFWLVIISVGAFAFFRSNDAIVLLDVVTGSGLKVSGSVIVAGSPADNGRVHIIISDRDKRYLASAVVPIANGAFAHDINLNGGAATTKGMQVAATYYGVLKGEKSPTAVTGQTAAYINAATPLDRSRIVWILGTIGSLILILIFLFTGELSQLKARTLFAVTYFMTFLALAVPIAVTVLVTQNRYLVEIMKNAPIGLVLGRSGTMTADEWLLNIGGTARTASPQTPSPSPSGTSAAPTQGGQAPAGAPSDAPSGPPVQSTSASVGVPAANQAAPIPANSPGAHSGATDTTAAAAVSAGSESDELTPSVFAGGLAVPFYIVMLAIFGAGINMTRQVPEVQAAYDKKIIPRSTRSVVVALLHAPGSIFKDTVVTDREEREAASYIRKRLIDSYMYLLAAPFLAIAVYYLLQVIATNTATPILVLMAFSTGLISDRIVTSITSLAERTLGGETPDGTGQKAPASPEGSTPADGRPASPDQAGKAVIESTAREDGAGGTASAKDLEASRAADQIVQQVESRARTTKD
jgi:hypothetical protein